MKYSYEILKSGFFTSTPARLSPLRRIRNGIYSKEGALYFGTAFTRITKVSDSVSRIAHVQKASRYSMPRYCRPFRYKSTARAGHRKRCVRREKVSDFLQIIGISRAAVVPKNRLRWK